MHFKANTYDKSLSLAVQIVIIWYWNGQWPFLWVVNEVVTYGIFVRFQSFRLLQISQQISFPIRNLHLVIIKVQPYAPIINLYHYKNLRFKQKSLSRNSTHTLRIPAYILMTFFWSELYIGEQISYQPIVKLKILITWAVTDITVKVRVSPPDLIKSTTCLWVAPSTFTPFLKQIQLKIKISVVYYELLL